MFGFCVFHHSLLKICGSHTCYTCLDLFSIFVSITQNSPKWVMDEWKWKQKIQTKWWWHFCKYIHMVGPISVPCCFLTCSNDYQRLSPLPDHLFSFFLFSFFLFFLFLFSSQATLLSPYPLAINTTHYSRSFGLPLQLKLKSSFRSVSISVSTVGLVVSDCGLSSWRHRRGSRLGIYGFIFVCLREFVSVVFGLWLRGGKIWNLEWEREKIWAMGKHKNK